MARVTTVIFSSFSSYCRSVPFFTMYKVIQRDTLHFSISDQLRRSLDIKRSDVILSLKRVTGSDFTNIKCVQASPSGNSYRISFKPGALALREALFAKGLFVKGTFVYLHSGASEKPSLRDAGPS